MHFFLLGSLEVTVGDRTLQLGGVKQRLALALLLSRANELVPASQLMLALWPDETPISARKILHNAVSGIRKLLAVADSGPDAPQLLTKAPGYLLQVSPEQVDLMRFQLLVQQGQGEVAAGQWAQAAEVLGQALGLWRGPMLSDLLEAGADWPEIGLASTVRLTAIEDRTEALLRLGRGGELLGELEALAEQEPLRERLCGQLMRVLYQHGRQAEALAVYRRTRTVLAEQLGLDPNPQLQELERAILNHDLDTPPTEVPESVPEQREVAALSSRESLELEEIQQISTVLVVASAPPGQSLTAEGLDLVRDYVGAVLAQQARDREVALLEEPEADLGSFLAEVGAGWQDAGDGGGSVLWLASTGVREVREFDTWRAVRLARGVHSQLTVDRGGLPGGGGVPPFEVRIVVTTGNARVRRGSAEGAVVWPCPEQDLLARCLRLLTDEGRAPVRMCATTLEAVSMLDRAEHLPFVARQDELETLDCLLEATRVKRQPHLVTVFGHAGVGRSRLIKQWLDRVAGDPGVSCVVVRSQAPITRSSPTAELASLVRAAAGVEAGARAAVVDIKLAELIERVVDEHRCSWVLAHLSTLLNPDRGGDSLAEAAVEACAVLFEALAGWRPLVLVVEDLHWADTAVVDFLNLMVTRLGGVPLLVVATSRPELLDRHPVWGAGWSRSCSLWLQGLSDEETLRVLWNSYAAPGEKSRGRGGRWSPEDLRVMVAPLGGNPLFAVEYGRVLRESPTGATVAEMATALPYSVRSRLALLLNSLPTPARVVLYDVALFDDGATESVLGVLARQGGQPVPYRWLRYLEHRDILRRVTGSGGQGEAEYVFVSAHLRAVARARVPEAVLARKRCLIASPANQPEILTG
ncbi:hypothetical protein GCM10010174_68240 [Kutzneria viridogrisea]|uniref:DNA-binding SARP family transcriptional activator n=1 Tax=Kutzneria viridogrisea TaxID=47990 RepID=A0ABR6B939_9PSEU|nr:DNA-binding SARP family transcriptional activator [Kutzneria viridogrisea]